MFVKRFTKKILQKVKIPSETAPDIMSVRNNICLLYTSDAADE